MSLVTKPIMLVVGQTVQVPPPQNPGQLETVTIANLSGLQLVITIGSAQYYQQPWTESRYNFNGTDRISAAPAAPSGTQAPGAAAQLNCTWFVKGEKPEGTWPISLVANALAATISGGEVVLAGQVPVINGDPSPLDVAVSNNVPVHGNVTTTPGLTNNDPGTQQTTIHAGPFPTRLDNNPAGVQGVWVQSLSTNSAAVFIGGPGVDAGTGLELLPGAIIGPILVSDANQFHVAGTPGDVVATLAV